MKKRKIKIQELKQEDMEEIIKLKASLFAQHAKIDDFYKPKKNLKEMYRNHIQTIIDSDEHKIFVAKEDKKILGFVEGIISQISDFFENNTLGFVYEIFVKEEYRKKGVAKRLLEVLVKWLKSRKVKIVEVVVDSRNKNATQAWRKLGFVEYQKKMKLRI